MTYKPEKTKMVEWYNPIQLLKTAQEVAVSTIFGKHADRRLVQVLGSEKMMPYDFSKGRDEIWVDYVSDVGDGGNSTYAVAHYLAQPQLPNTGAGETLPRGDVLIMGGDEVYPTADRQEYLERLEIPYSTAMAKNVGSSPSIFAIPGNHDWYDSLASFSSIFFDRYYFPICEEDVDLKDDGDKPGMWKAPQARSYFALKLPHRYWLIGIDVQLDHDLDVQQIEYFKSLVLLPKETKESGVSSQSMPQINYHDEAIPADLKILPGDKIILCCAEPYWIYAGMYSELDPTYKNTRLGRDYLEKEVFKGCQIVAYLAGDLHHYYSLFDKEKGVVRITAGGGGAFLHPTHGDLANAFSKYTENDGSFHTKHVFPSVKESSGLGFGNLTFLFKNWKFGWLTAIVYFLAAWSVLAFFPESTIADLEQHLDFGAWLYTIATATGYVALKTPVAIMWGIGIFAGFWLFTDTHNFSYRMWGGTIHGLAHIVACLFISWAAHGIVTQLIYKPIKSLSDILYGIPTRNLNLIFSALIIALLAWVVSSIIMGLYLFVSLNIFGRHSNEAFSSLANQDYKNFLRLKIDDTGLTIFPIGIRRVPRKWREARPADNTVSDVVPDDSDATPPHLIHAPIHIPKST